MEGWDSSICCLSLVWYVLSSLFYTRTYYVGSTQIWVVFYRFWNDIAGTWVSWYQTSEHSWLKIAEVNKPCVFVSLVLRILYCSKSLFIILTGHSFLGFFFCISLPSLCVGSNTVLRSSHIRWSFWNLGFIPDLAVLMLCFNHFIYIWKYQKYNFRYGMNVKH